MKSNELSQYQDRSPACWTASALAVATSDARCARSSRGALIATRGASLLALSLRRGGRARRRRRAGRRSRMRPSCSSVGGAGRGVWRRCVDVPSDARSRGSSRSARRARRSAGQRRRRRERRASRRRRLPASDACATPRAPRPPSTSTPRCVAPEVAAARRHFRRRRRCCCSAACCSSSRGPARQAFDAASLTLFPVAGRPRRDAGQRANQGRIAARVRGAAGRQPRAGRRAVQIADGDRWRAPR